MQDCYDIQYVIDNIQSFSYDELIEFDFCKPIDTPRYKNDNILVFRNGTLYEWSSKKFLDIKSQYGKKYVAINKMNTINNKMTQMIIPYIVCYLFKDDYLKHDSRDKNYFIYKDGNKFNCDANNIMANYYKYDIVNHVSDNVVEVNICGYKVLLNLDFYTNELHKYNFRVIKANNLAYFVSENTGKTIRLHQIVMGYYYPEAVMTGVIDHYNHNTLDNTIENLKHTNHIINSMNNKSIVPSWNNSKDRWNVRYKVDGVCHSKSFSVYRYGSKENAYQEAINYINEVALPYKTNYLKNKELQLKITELNDLIKYFVNNDMRDVVYQALSDNNITIDNNVG